MLDFSVAAKAAGGIRPADFEQKYKSRFGNNNQIATAANGHDMALLLYTIARSISDRPDAEKLLELLQNAQPIEGASGTFQYREDPVGGAFFDFPVVLKRVNAGHIEEIEANT